MNVVGTKFLLWCKFFQNCYESESKQFYEEKSNQHGKENFEVGIQNFVDMNSVSVVNAKDDNYDETNNEFGSNDELINVQLIKVKSLYLCK